MSAFGFSQPWMLLLLPLALLPLLLRGQPAFAYPSLQRLPVDGLSRWLEYSWRGLGAIAVSALAVAMAGPYLTGKSTEQLGRGAHIMVVLDRSASMNDDFAGQRSQGDKASKMAAARSVLERFIDRSRQDLLGMVTFNTSPIMVAPLSGDREAALAGLRATDAGGVGFTAVAKGLAMGLDSFRGKPVTGARVILLVSDGGAHLDGKTRDLLRASFHRQSAALYWIYLRDSNGGSLEQVPEAGNEDAYPEYQLHTYFKTLGVPYRAYEAENPQAVSAALADVARLKNLPVHYRVAEPRRDVAHFGYVLAVVAVLVLLLLHLSEVKQWRTT